MIIDSPYIVELARGVERRIMQEGDVQLLVPPVLTPILKFQLPHTFAIGTGILANQSVTASFANTKTNGAATNQEILRLPQGLYTIQVHASLRANYTTIGNATADWLVRIITPGLTNAFNLINLWAIVGANISEFASYDFMLDETRIIQVVIQPNAVGQTIDSSVNVNAVRRL